MCEELQSYLDVGERERPFHVVKEPLHHSMLLECPQSHMLGVHSGVAEVLKGCEQLGQQPQGHHHRPCNDIEHYWPPEQRLNSNINLVRVYLLRVQVLQQNQWAKTNVSVSREITIGRISDNLSPKVIRIIYKRQTLVSLI